MSHELRRGMTRIISNYTRLLVTLGLGIIAVPLTIRWLGEDVFGIISLLGANIGIAAIFRQIIMMSLVRELASAYHTLDDEDFARSYATINIITVVCAGLTILTFALLLVFVPVFKISPQFVGPARWFVFGQGMMSSVSILLAPTFNMYLVKERFVEYNIWFVLNRAGNLIAVLLLGYALVIDDPARGLMLLGITWAGLSAFTAVSASLVMALGDRRLIPSIRGADRNAASQILSTFSWNTAVQVGMNVHEQIPPLLLNIFSGTLANAAWGIGFRFVAYIRMCTTGVQFGSDAVSARLASGEDSEKSRRNLQRLINIQTKLTAMIALPASIIVFTYGWPIFDVWVGHSLKEYDTVMTMAVYMSRILAVALASRAISDTWLIVLYGAGFVRSYAPWVFAGGIIAPLASLALMFTLPDHLVLYAPPVMFAAVLFFVHLLGLPIITGRCLNIRPMALLGSLTRPCIATLLALGCALVLLLIGGRLGDLGFWTPITPEHGRAIDWRWMLGSLGVFAAVYTLATFALVLDESERTRIKGMLLRGARLATPTQDGPVIGEDQEPDQ